MSKDKRYLKAAQGAAMQIICKGDIVQGIGLPSISGSALLYGEVAKVLNIWRIEIPRADDSLPVMYETWLDLEIISSRHGNAQGTQLSDKIGTVKRQIGKRSFQEYVQQRDHADQWCANELKDLRKLIRQHEAAARDLGRKIGELEQREGALENAIRRYLDGMGIGELTRVMESEVQNVD